MTTIKESPFSLSNVEAINLGKSCHGISTGIGFFDHMLDQFNSHAQIGVSVTVSSSSSSPKSLCDDAKNRFADSPELQEVLMGQVGEALGTEFRKLLHSDSATMARSSRFCCPLDEALVECLLTFPAPSTDAPGTLETFTLPPYGHFPSSTGRTRIGQMQTTPHVQTFFSRLAISSGLTVRLIKVRGCNGHHIVESAFKAFSRALRNLLDHTDTSSTTTTRNEELWGQSSKSHEESLSLHRQASSNRATKETSISATLQLDGGTSGISVHTGIPTLDEFYSLLSAEAGLSLDVTCSGDTWVDDHHTAEDVSIAIGKVLNASLGTKAGLNRMWCAVQSIPSCEGASVEVVMDLSNRPCLTHDLSLDREGREYVEEDGDVNEGKVCISVEMMDHVLDSLVANGQMTVHIVETCAGGELPSLVEVVRATAKAFGRALRYCAAVDPRRAGKTASSKGTLSA